MVVDGDGQRALGGVLTDDIALEEFADFDGLGQLVELDVVSVGEFLFDDLVAQVYAFIADIDAGARNELFDLLLTLPAERALQQVTAVSNARHGGGVLLSFAVGNESVARVTSGVGPDATRMFRRGATDKAESRRWYLSVFARTYRLTRPATPWNPPLCPWRVAAVIGPRVPAPGRSALALRATASVSVEFAMWLFAAPHDTVLISDGGLATELEARGHDLSDDLWSARLLVDAPEEIVAVHCAFFRAGASIATTASYQASFDGFAERGIRRNDATGCCVAASNWRRPPATR